MNTRVTISRLLSVLLILVLLVMSTGCVKYSESDAIKMIEENLRDKYHGNFKVVAIERDVYGGNGVPFGSSVVHVAVVTEVNSGVYFIATCNGKTGALSDYYPAEQETGNFLAD